MPFTDNTDIFVAVNEDGVNRLVGHVFVQRPSLFNYGTPGVHKRSKLLCREINAHPVVISRGNPLLTEIPYVPVFGTSYALEAVAQAYRLRADFHPTDVISLPAELFPPLNEQQLAMTASLAAGLGCSRSIAVDVVPDTSTLDERRETTPLPTRDMICFGLQAFATGRVDFVGPGGDQHIRAELEGFELVDVRPVGLEDALECYATLVARLGLLPRLSIPTIRIVQEAMGAQVTVEPTTTVTNNPAVEDDQVKVFLDASVAASPGGGGGGGGGSPIGVTVPRTRTGAFDLIGAVSEPTVKDLVQAVISNFSVSFADSANLGPFTASYDFQAHLEGGSVDLRNDGTILVEEVDIKWDKLELCIGLDIPELCVGGFCIIPNPFGGCLVRAPEICVFSGSPDVEFCLDLGGFITSELSMALDPDTRYLVDPGRPAGMNDWDARDAGIPNHWQVIVDPVWLDFDLIDIADTVGDLLDAIIDTVVDDLLGFLPGWARDLIKAILGPIVDLIRGILDIGDDIDEWLSDLLGVSLGIFDLVIDLFVGDLGPLLEVEDPVPILPSEPNKIAVLMPIEYVGVRVDDDELIAEADIGAP